MTVIVGDCVEVMQSMEPDSIDAIVCDPPYGLRFMGRKWDGIGGDAMSQVEWHRRWLAEAYRVLKPGGHLLAFSGSRTMHFLAMGLELAGFRDKGDVSALRDTVCWLFGSGFPKSLDVSKAIDKAAGVEREVVGVGAAACSDIERGLPCSGHGDADGRYGETVHAPATAPATDLARQWEGWGTALKPAWEPCVVARKPLRGTVAANVERYGTGALNIDACRIPTDDDLNGGGYSGGTPKTMFDGLGRLQPHDYIPPSGRWPANVALDEEAARLLDEMSGPRPASHDQIASKSDPSGAITYGRGVGGYNGIGYGDSGGASRFFYVAKSSRAEREAWGRLTAPAGEPGEAVDRDPADRGSSHPRAGSGRLTERDRIAAWVNAVLQAALLGDTDRLVQRVTEGFTMAEGSAKSTSSSGSGQLGARSRKGSKSTTSTATSSTTDSTTSNSLTHSRINASIRDALSRMAGGLSPADYAACVSRLIERTGTSDEAATRSMDAAVNAISARLSELNKLGGLPLSNASLRVNLHPTVKPLALMEWLIKLVTPEGGVILDPFCGSGSTLVAAKRLNVRAIGIEQDERSAEIARQRIAAQWEVKLL